MICGITEASATRKTQDAVHAKLWVDDSELVHAHFAPTNGVPKTRRGKSGKFLDLLGARLGPWNEFALARPIRGDVHVDVAGAPSTACTKPSL